MNKQSNFPRQLALWLLSNMDVKSTSLVLRDGSKISMDEFDVHIILGLPYGGSDIVQSKVLSSCDMEYFRSLLMLRPGCEITLDYVESVLYRDYGSSMSPRQRQAFKVAAVIYADAFFLGPRGNSPKVNLDILNNIDDPNQIHKKNWSRYVIQSLRAAAGRVQDALNNGNKTFTIDGCLLFVVIFYLDNLDSGPIIPYQSSVPRIVYFTRDLVKKLQCADRDTSMCYGLLKARRSNEVIYTRSGNKPAGPFYVVKREPRFFRGSVMDYVRTLIHDNNDACAACLTELTNYIDISHHIHSVKKQLCPDTLPLNIVMSCRAQLPWPRGEATRCNRPDIHGPTDILNYEHEIVAKEVIGHSDFGRSRFALCFTSQRPSNIDVEELTSALKNLPDEEKHRVWFKHDVPYHISMDGVELLRQAAPGTDFEYEFMDAVIRFYTQLDDKSYSVLNDNRWCHYLPASFSVDVLRCGDLQQSEDVHSMFIGSHLKYNVEDCRMIFAPVFLELDWHCYVWDFKCRMITVLDPTCMNMEEKFIENKHSKFVDMMHEAIFDCKNTFFRGWDVSRVGWERNYAIIAGAGGSRSDSGVYALHYARFFDGNAMRKLIPPGKVDKYRNRLLFEVLTMEGNTGHLPSIFGSVNDSKLA
uniref:Ubiquitin-like protease family profile domain-containing protein n=1 Tax=Arundo donax TaxID=35708 RepID=A0A0A9A5J5_ARUDO